jgi:hypothetical protein
MLFYRSIQTNNNKNVKEAIELVLYKQTDLFTN